MKRVLIIFLIWFLINLFCSIVLAIYLSMYDHQKVELGDVRPFLFYVFLSLIELTLVSIPTLAFNLFYFSLKKITHAEFIKQLYKTYLGYSILICLIFLVAFFHFYAILLSLPGLIVSFMIITIFKYLPGEDVTN